MQSHFALIGMGIVKEHYPLYFDATNEKVLSLAVLNFHGYAYFFPETTDKDNITAFEFIPWILRQCETVPEAKELLERINLVNIPFSDELPLSPLHWMIADQKQSIVVESIKIGLHVYDNPVGVLTNNPTFDHHLFNLNNYRHLTTGVSDNTFSDQLQLDIYSIGL